MSELEDFLQHAQARADWEPGEPRTPCREATPLGYARNPEHAKCAGGGCGCVCHAPTDSERALWRQLAGEIEAWVGRHPEPEVLPLWEES